MFGLSGGGVGPPPALRVNSWRGEALPARFRPWHESTKQQHVLAQGLSKHQSGNRCNVQQRATQGRARCKRDVWNADT